MKTVTNKELQYASLNPLEIGSIGNSDSGLRKSVFQAFRLGGIFLKIS
jgi:hypothetical protein